ncbi:EAL domain-containing protein [Geodermatophilus sp. DSM 44513]|uniref:EAL domain-containing protein n=1 Tax=Geodermatophilus sp. DSM 44513 TaxID=1528104 RepID=UPI001277CCAA|nr:EAL domain-containing protein [Geodermatophilus sp. DSM 44513]WNV75592.1 EAL domain-containing protein [Geodermatophilus sp. DSM 44513]
MSLRRRLALGLTTLVLLSAVCAGAGLYFLGHVNRNVERMYTQEVVALEALDDVKSALYRIRGDALEHILAGSVGSETRLAGEVADQERRARERLEEYRRTRLSAEEGELLGTFLRHFDVYTGRVRTDILPSSAAGDKELAEQLARGDAVEEFRAAREAMNDLMDYALQRAEERSEEARRLYLTSVVALLIVAAVIAALGRVIGARLSRSVLGPLRELIAHFRRIESGDLGQEVPVGRPDEMGEVMAALGNTQRRLLETDAERREALDSLRENEHRFRTAFENAPVGMAIVTLDGRWQEVNAALSAMLGRSAAELVAGGSAAVTHPGDEQVERDVLRAVLGEAVATGIVAGAAAPRHIRDKRYLRPDGRLVVAEISAAVVLGRTDRPTHCLLQVVDVTDTRRATVELEHLAHRDSLTGLPSRSLFLRRLRAALAVDRPGALHAVLFVDLDRFKFVNDVLGHRAGDELLVATARRIETCLRRGDTVARFGGDEFIVLLTDVRDTAEVVHVAERVLAVAREPVVLDGRPIVCSASVGIAYAALGTEEVAADDLLHDADVAMYEAKTAGKDQYRVAGPEQRVRSLARLALEADLRVAVQEELFTLHYQPIVRLATGETTGVEALVRWHHPERGLLPPAEFLPLAEEVGLVVPLGRWILHEACRTAQQWRERHGLPFEFLLHVNVSARQVRVGLLEEIDEVLSATGFPADRLCLEVTESLLLDDDEVVRALLEGISARGIRLAIDDFGQEYSALGRLKKLPVTCLKIDRGFVEQLASDERDVAIVRAVVELARSMALDVVVEGVETDEQAGVLQELGCDLGQGYLLGRPASAAEVGDRLAAASAPGSVQVPAPR